RDLVELKRPDMDVLHFDANHRDYYWSSAVSKAIGQCHRYLDVLHEVAASGLRDHPEIVAYHPRVVIVIGRSNDWPEPQMRGLHGLNHRLSGVTVMTYDQLLAQGERLIQAVQPPAMVRDEQDRQSSEDDEIPW
ncbi:MAG: Shedu anti-phage system protein SduA domain-containing protein, partial [Rhodanobacteraceae bacterium]